MGPAGLSFVSDSYGLEGTWRFTDELQDMYLHVLCAQMRWLIEVSADTFVWVAHFNVSEVMYESVFEPEHSLSDVLFIASFAGDGINEVGAPAGDIFHGSERF